MPTALPAYSEPGADTQRLEKATGDPERADGPVARRHRWRPLRCTKWVRKSLRPLVKQLRQKKFNVGPKTARRLLKALGHSLRSNRQEGHKRQEAEQDRQMRYLARKRRKCLKAKKRVISVDTKLKELIGLFKNPGRTWRRGAHSVLAIDLHSHADGKAIPYGVYDLARNLGFHGVGISHETAELAVNVMRRWWQTEGQAAYPDQTELLTRSEADGGGANSYRSWLSKRELKRLADDAGLTITVSHYPTSASKLNWIEPRLFCHISANWAGEPLVSYETILTFIRTTMTQTRLCCYAYLDRKAYLTERKLTPEQQQAIRLKKHRVLPKWNYTIRPRPPAG